MTNGEKLCIDFPNMRYTISEHRVITTIGVAASFDLDWWNAEYKEPKKGHWDKDGACPFCGYFRQWDDDAFCGHCGAQLGEVEE